MTILFPNSPLDPRRVEPDFARECEAAHSLGLDTLLLDSDALFAGETSRALRLVRASEEPQVLVYRGWMLRPEIYAALYEAMLERGWQLLNDPATYARCHLLPEWYRFVKGRTPRSIWLPIPECFEPARVLQAAASFGSSALIVKDYVKSRKHEWNDACFVANCQDTKEVVRVTGNFLARQAESLVGGLVLREFVPLREVAAMKPGGAPIVNEWRSFWLDGKIISAPHVSAGVDAGGFESPPPQVLPGLDELSARLQSHFWTVDVAQTARGEWIVIEIGDGGVSGLPPSVDAKAFYMALL